MKKGTTFPKSGGQSSKYDVAHIKKLEELLDKHGYRLTQSMIAAELNVLERTIENWRQVHPAFTEAYELVMQKAKSMFIEKGMVGVDERAKYKKLDTRLYSFLAYATHKIESQARSAPVTHVYNAETLEEAKAIADTARKALEEKHDKKE